MHYTFKWRFLPYMYLIILLMFQIQNAHSENVLNNIPNNTSSSSVSKEFLLGKIEWLNNKQGLDDNLKSNIMNYYQRAEDNVGLTEWFLALSQSYQDSLEQAPAEIKLLQQQLEDTQGHKITPENTKLHKFSNIELEKRLNVEKSKLSNLVSEIKSLEAKLEEQNQRPQLIREEMIIAREDRDAAQQELDKTRSGSLSKYELEARQTYWRSFLNTRNAELKMLEIEAISNPIRIQRLKSKLQLAELQKTILQPLITYVDDELFERKKAETETRRISLSEAEQQAADKHAIIQQATHTNFEHNKRLHEISIKIEQFEDNSEAINAVTDEIEKNYKNAEKRINLAGLSPPLGKMLRDQRKNLPVGRSLAGQIQTIEDETAITSLEQFRIEERLRQLDDIDNELLLKLSSIAANTNSAQHKQLESDLRALLIDEKELLNKLSVAYSTYIRRLGDYAFASQQMFIQAEKYAQYLDERLFWVPSSVPFSLNYLTDMGVSLTWFLSPENWKTIFPNFKRNSSNHPVLALMSLASILLLLFLRHKACVMLNRVSEKVSKLYSDKFSYTLQAFLYTLVLVAPLPLFLLYFGWFLSVDTQFTDFGKAVGEGLKAAVLPLFILQYVYRMCSPSGICELHFLWPEHVLTLLRKQLLWLRFIAVPCVFVIAMTNQFDNAVYSEVLGRLAMIITMFMMAYIFTVVLRPGGILLKPYLTTHPACWTARLRYLWYPFIISIPVLVIVFSISGYYLSALELQQKLIISLRLIFIAIIIHELVIRWLTLVNRQLALKNARQKRKTADMNVRQASLPNEEAMPQVDEHLLDIPKINSQTIKLLDLVISMAFIVAMWIVWKNIIPAFSFLDNVVLWQESVYVNQQQSFKITTLSNLFLAGIYLFVAIIAVRNCAGFMEVFFFRQLALDSGNRYAVTQLVQYFLISIAFISIANELGGSWSQVQWLVAALSVGLGFGLQEIFANMVSGIMLLFESPIRVGDTVTVGDITGKVCRIQMRATHIVDWDQKELVVPNKTFITGELINWSLTDPITRIVIPVGIAYHSDVDKAHQVILQTVQNNEQVLAEPEPKVLFLGFGDSSLDFSIRAFVSEYEHRLSVIHELHVAINKALKENAIEIPFPQRDIHVRTTSQEQTSPA